MWRPQRTSVPSTKDRRDIAVNDDLPHGLGTFGHSIIVKPEIRELAKRLGLFRPLKSPLLFLGRRLSRRYFLLGHNQTFSHLAQANAIGSVLPEDDSLSSTIQPIVKPERDDPGGGNGNVDPISGSSDTVSGKLQLFVLKPA